MMDRRVEISLVMALAVAGVMLMFSLVIVIMEWTGFLPEGSWDGVSRVVGEDGVSGIHILRRF